MSMFSGKSELFLLIVLAGCPVSQISIMAGVSKVTITSWVKKADERGVDALRSKQGSGRPPRLSTEQRVAIDSAIQSDPKNFGFKVWDGSSLSSYISNTFGVQISVRQCQRLFYDLGYSHIRSQSYPSKGYEDSKKAIADPGIWAVVSENRESGLLARTVPHVVSSDGGNVYCHHYSFAS